MRKLLVKLLECFVRRDKPVPGKDATWVAFCPRCGDYGSFASRGGYRLGGVERCCGCGTKSVTKGVSQEDIDRMVVASKYHWKKFPLVPYDWHVLEDKDRWKVLFPKKVNRE